MGRVGSGKTLTEVRDMFDNLAQLPTYTNIKVKLKHCKLINADMLIKKEVVDYKKNRKTGEDEPIYKLALNKEYWTKLKKPLNIVIDEAHQIVNSRKSFSKINICMSEFISLIRRYVSIPEGNSGSLVLISQHLFRLDIVCRAACTEFRYCIGHWQKNCMGCGAAWTETSEQPELLWYCPYCLSVDILKTNNVIEVYKFGSMRLFQSWEEGYKGEKGDRPWYAHYYITQVERFYNLYKTLQLENMFGQYT